MQNDDLKPCPFCGGQAEEVFPDASTRHFIRCTNCGGKSALNLASHGGSAKNDWNRRAAHSSAEAALAAAPAGAVKPLEDRIEDLARWIHCEVEWPEYDFPDHSWPDHPLDDGKRGNGYLKIIPRSSADQFREIAARIIASFASPVAQATDGWRLEVDDGTLVARHGSISITVAAQTMTIYDSASGQPAKSVEIKHGMEFPWFDLPAAPTPKADGEQ